MCFPTAGEPVAFAASRADAYTRTPSNGGKIIFDRTETDVGYGWNGRSGVFVCQVNSTLNTLEL